LKPQPGDILITLRPTREHANRDTGRRLAKLLKAMKRGYGFVVSGGPRDAKYGMPPATEPDPCTGPGCPACAAALE
jgi:hypothetical protein